MATAQNEPAATDHWKDQVLNTLHSLHSTTPPDCSVIVATKHIPTHKTALQLNSALLSGDASYNKESGLIEIELLPEFSDQFELISEIVKSFYTGTINVTNQNMLMLYKFAKCYSVQWLMDYIRPRFVEYITRDKGCETFVEVFKFAHSFWCTDLFDACIEVLDDALLGKIMKSNAALSKLDYFCMKTITSSEKLCVAEKDAFQLVTSWCKEETSRCQHLGSLLENIQYQLIDKSYLSDDIFDFVLDASSLDDMSRVLVLKKIKSAMKQVQGRSTRSIGKPESQNKSPILQNLSPDNDDSLRKISLIMSGQSLSDEDRNISDEELHLIVTEKFKYVKNDMREIVIDYLGSRGRVSSSSITACLQLFDVYRSPRILFLFLDSVTKDEQSYYRLYDVEWNKVSFETVSAIVTNGAIKDYLLQYDLMNIEYFNNSGYNIMLRFEGCSQIELIMLWALAHPNEVADIRKLLKTICYLKIPPEYLKVILFPCIQNIIPDIKVLKCEPHSHDDMKQVKQVIFKRVSKNIYLTRNFREKHIIGEGTNKVNYTFQLSSVLYVSSTRSYVKQGCLYLQWTDSRSHKFVLYDAANPCRFNYPIFTEELPLSIVKRFVENAVDLCVMFIKRPS